jgi:hypothetical protein
MFYCPYHDLLSLIGPPCELCIREANLDFEAAVIEGLVEPLVPGLDEAAPLEFDPSSRHVLVRE